MRHGAARLRAARITLLATAAFAPLWACAGVGGHRMTAADHVERRAEITGQITSQITGEITGEITGMLARAASSWNRGDLDAFMSDYLPGDRTTFVGGRDLLRGTPAIRAVYASRFAAGALRDSLSFVLQDVDPLAPDLLNVVATYVLVRRVDGRDSVTSRGPTSLVMRRVDGRWLIVHDHSS